MKRFYAKMKKNGPSYDQVCNISWEIEINDGKIMSVCKNIDGCDGLYQFDDYYYYERGEENFLKKTTACRNFFYNVDPDTYYQILNVLDEEEKNFFSTALS